MIVTPSGIAGQRFYPLDSHRLELSPRAGYLVTASRSVFLSIQPPVRAWASKRNYWAGGPAPQDAPAALGRRLGEPEKASVAVEVTRKRSFMAGSLRMKLFATAACRFFKQHSSTSFCQN